MQIADEHYLKEFANVTRLEHLDSAERRQKTARGTAEASCRAFVKSENETHRIRGLAIIPY